MLKEFHFVVEESILAVTKKEIDHRTTGRQQEKESAADCSICFVLFLMEKRTLNLQI